MAQSQPGTPRSAASDTSLVEEENRILTPQQFNEQIATLKKEFKTLMRVTLAVGSVKKGDKFTTNKGEQIGRKDLDKYNKAFLMKLDQVKGFFRDAKKRKSRAGGNGAQLSAPFYVSDQLVNFFKEPANLGNGLAYLATNLPNKDDAVNASRPDASTQKGMKDNSEALVKTIQGNSAMSNLQRELYTYTPERLTVQNSLGLLLTNQIGTSPILTSLLALYNRVNKLKSDSNSARIRPDSRMTQFFGRGTNTRFTLGGADITPTSVPAEMQGEKAEKFAQHLAHVNYSAFERLASIPQKVNKRGRLDVPFVPEGKQAPGTDDYGMLYSTNVTMIAYFRVPKEILSAEYQAALSSAEVLNEAARTQAYLRLLLDAHKEVGKDEKKLRQNERRKANASAKSASASSAPAKSASAKSATPSATPALPTPSRGGIPVLATR